MTWCEMHLPAAAVYISVSVDSEWCRGGENSEGSTEPLPCVGAFIGLVSGYGERACVKFKGPLSLRGRW
jgi:hypothetical protein